MNSLETRDYIDDLIINHGLKAGEVFKIVDLTNIKKCKVDKFGLVSYLKNGIWCYTKYPISHKALLILKEREGL